ncbi:MAG: HD domain-containing protein [Candidatus Caenarcaniphilales bacterium]|jgi:HD-GYP domain-containing protein (c-di-GMP phosphodiesterase class II)|nr:HD domain-containing protein [Candidatus Caenarcaniphilales bacterium]
MQEEFYNIAKALIYALEIKDPYTSGHSYRVYKVAKELGLMFNLSTEDQFNLEGGALLHDIGKIGIKDDVLFKPSSLTLEEFTIMKTHVILGANIISQIPSLKRCLEPVLFHHERVDGKGYPHGAAADEIPFIAKITTIADAYDAMTTNRVYMPARSPEEGLEEILRHSGTQFEPAIVEAFTDWWQRKYREKDPIISADYQYGKIKEEVILDLSRFH